MEQENSISTTTKPQVGTLETMGDITRNIVLAYF